ncbi:hypothetical protein Pta6605_36120 [Pseudomonas amygdali pv. tabaci]|nr:hypothetical protein Pta6605_36120 [Pseudomonas amygdali pv. tabaci]
MSDDCAVLALCSLTPPKPELPEASVWLEVLPNPNSPNPGNNLAVVLVGNWWAPA